MALGHSQTQLTAVLHQAQSRVQAAAGLLEGCSPCLAVLWGSLLGHLGYLLCAILGDLVRLQEETCIPVPGFQASICYLAANVGSLFHVWFWKSGPSSRFLCITVLTSGFYWLGRLSVSLSRTKLCTDRDGDDPASISKRMVGLLAN